MLAVSVAFFAIVSAAILTGIWLVEDFRSTHTNQVLGAGVGPNVDAPAGLVAMQRVNSLKEFEQVGGFKPFIPMYVPGSTETDFTLALTLPDANGNRIGRVGYSSKNIADADGIAGPTVVLAEIPGAPGAAADPTLHLLAGSGRALGATIACQGLAVSVQLYFSPAPAADQPAVTPHMTAVGQEFLDGLNAQCTAK
jgi:hypothetical protein